MKILHMADIHARDKDIDEIRKCMEFIIETADAEKPDIIIIAGDTFDSQNVKLDSASAKYIFDAVTRMADIAPVAVLIGTPSHDGMAAEVLRHINADHAVHVSTKPEQVYYHWGEVLNTTRPIGDPASHSPQAILSMIPAPTKQFFQGDGSITESDGQIAQAMSAIFSGFGIEAGRFSCPHILVGHWNTTGAFVNETQVLTGVDIEVSKDQMGLANPDLVCLGHIHKAQDMGSNVFYSGSIYRKDFGELDAKGFYIHEFNDDGELTSKFIETPTRKLVKAKRDFTADGIEGMDAVLAGLPLNGDAAGAIVRIEIQVWQDEAGKIDKDAVQQYCMDHGAESAEIILIRLPRENVRSTRLLSLPTLRAKIEEMAAIKAEPVPAGVPGKADLLESMTPEALISQLSGAQ